MMSAEGQIQKSMNLTAGLVASDVRTASNIHNAQGASPYDFATEAGMPVTTA
jgi:hypothetical protein